MAIILNQFFSNLAFLCNSYHMPLSKKNIVFYITILFLSTSIKSFSQPFYLNINHETNIRYEKIHFSDSNFHSNIKPFLDSDIQSNDSIGEKLEIVTKSAFLNKLFNESVFERKFKKTGISINPIINIAPQFFINRQQTLENYYAGLSIGGNIGTKLAFKLDGFYGIQSYQDHIALKIDSSRQIPGFGKYLLKKGANYYYPSITGYLSYSPLKYLNIQTGIGGNFWGDGYRSLFLSDNSPNYPFFKATINVWKFKYIWLFGYLQDFNTNFQNNVLKSKLLFSHYLSWNATSWLNINFFESIVSNPVDSMGITNFNTGYLNPVIFFRPIEFAGGSADNALLGFGFKIKLWKKYQLYSQFIIDEFVWSQMKSGQDWWGNKFGLQSGIKAFHVFNVKNLYLQFEYNSIRPYTYSYSNSILNYGNHFQALSHPSGANFEEFVFIAHYHKNRFSFALKAIISKAGMDSDSISYGQDIYKSYTLRASDFGNKFKQGNMGNFSNLETKICWLINPKLDHSLFLSLNKQNIQLPSLSADNIIITLGIKYLLFDNDIDYL